MLLSVTRPRRGDHERRACALTLRPHDPLYQLVAEDQPPPAEPNVPLRQSRTSRYGRAERPAELGSSTVQSRPSKAVRDGRDHDPFTAPAAESRPIGDLSPSAAAVSLCPASGYLCPASGFSPPLRYHHPVPEPPGRPARWHIEPAGSHGQTRRPHDQPELSRGSGRDQFQLSGGWDLRHPRPYDAMTAVTTTHNLTTERTYLTAPAQLTAT